MHSIFRRTIGFAAAVSAALAGLVATAPNSAAAGAECANLTAPIYRTINPHFPAQLLTPWPGEANNSTKRYGFSDVRGVLGYASLAKRAGYVPIYRMYNPRTVDFMWVTSDAEVTKAISSGYVKQNVTHFYAPTTASACTVAVHRLVKGSHTRDAWAADELASLKSSGWTDAGTSFYLSAKNPRATTSTPSPSPTASRATPTPTPTPSPTASKAKATPTPTVPAGNAVAAGGSTFGLAVIPDTQAETNIVANTSFLNRTNWMVANKDAFDLKYVLHTGDMVNWGWVDPVEYTRAKAAMDVLTKAGLPYDLSVGNHDTRAVGWDGITGSSGYGGSAYMYNPECPTRLSDAECKSWLLVRHTEEFNQAFPLSSISNVGGVFEAGKIDNNWTTFTANNTKWLVLSIEFAPRKTAVEWARNVVATHPDYNVIIQTHYYLDGNGNISTSNAGYGETSGKYIYDQIVSKYSNVKLVFSGHTGGFTNRTDTNNGNTVVSYLGNDLGGPTNDPVRILTINTDTGKITSTVYNPIKNTTAGTTTNTITIIK